MRWVLLVTIYGVCGFGTGLVTTRGGVSNRALGIGHVLVILALIGLGVMLKL